MVEIWSCLGSGKLASIWNTKSRKILKQGKCEQCIRLLGDVAQYHVEEKT